MTEINLKNTKNEIYDAYAVALKRIKELENSKVDTAKLVIEKGNQETIKSAENVIGLNILNPEITGKYADVLKAIELQETKLKDIYGIEVEANSLSALVNANLDKQLEYAKKDKETDEAFRKKCSDRELEYKELEKKLEEVFRTKSRDLSKKYEDEEILLKQKRSRDEENYKYDIERNRKLENDNWEDTKAQREKVIADKEKAVAEREAKMNEMETLIKELQAKVDSIPELVQIAKKDAEENKSKELACTYAIEKNSIVRDCEWEKKMLGQQVESLTKELDKSNSKATELEGKLNEAYKEIKEIATQTVKSSGIKILDTGKKD